MHHELFEEMQALIARDDLTDADEDRLSELLELHDSGQAYFADDASGIPTDESLLRHFRGQVL